MTPNPDDLMLHRFLDGELDADAAQAFEARLAAEAGLRQRVEFEHALRRGFAAVRAEPSFESVASPGFTAAVVAAARRLPSRTELEADDVATVGLVLCRRLVIAAAVLIAAGLIWHLGLFSSGRSTKLQAAPDEVQQEMDRLDALVTGAGAPRGK